MGTYRFENEITDGIRDITPDTSDWAYLENGRFLIVYRQRDPFKYFVKSLDYADHVFEPREIFTMESVETGDFTVRLNPLTPTKAALFLKDNVSKDLYLKFISVTPLGFVSETPMNLIQSDVGDKLFTRTLRENQIRIYFSKHSQTSNTTIVDVSLDPFLETFSTAVRMDTTDWDLQTVKINRFQGLSFFIEYLELSGHPNGGIFRTISNTGNIVQSPVLTNIIPFKNYTPIDLNTGITVSTNNLETNIKVFDQYAEELSYTIQYGVDNADSIIMFNQHHFMILSRDLNAVVVQRLSDRFAHLSESTRRENGIQIYLHEIPKNDDWFDHKPDNFLRIDEFTYMFWYISGTGVDARMAFRTLDKKVMG